MNCGLKIEKRLFGSTLEISLIASFTCNNNQPWAVNDQLAYGYAAAYILGESEWTWCCACYELVFTQAPVVGKRMIVQVTNTGGDLGVSFNRYEYCWNCNYAYF